MSNTADDLKRKNNQAGSTAVNSKNNKGSKKKGTKSKASATVKKQDTWKVGATVSSKTPELVAVTKETVAKQEKETAEIYRFPGEETDKKPEIIIPAKTFSKETAEVKKEEPYVISAQAPEVKVEVTANANNPVEAEKVESVVHVSKPNAAVKEEKPLVAERFPQVAMNRNADVSEGRWLGRFLFLSVLVIAGVFGTNFLKGGMVNKVVDDGSEKVVVSDPVEASKTDTVQVADSEVQVADAKVEAPVEPQVIEVDGDLAEDAAVIEAEAKLDAAQAEQVAKGEDQKESVPAKELTAEDALIQAFNRSNVYVPNKKEYAAKIAKQTENTTVSPLVVSAVAMAESYLSPKAVSKNGDKKGLMQISVDKEAYIQGLQGKKAKAGDLFDADYNLGLGVWYLDYLNKKYEGNLSKVLYAYSNGEDSLQRVLDGKETAPKYTGRHFANLQRYYNALAEKGADRLILSLPVAEPKATEEKEQVEVAEIENDGQPIPGKADVEMAKSAVIVEDPERIPYSDEWAKSIMGMKLKATAQEKAEIVSLIKEQSLIYDMDPAYIASVVMAESAFNSKAVSKRGKRGLFQLEPQWARVVAATLGMKWQGDDALFDPAYNIELGTAYLQHLSLLFDNDFEKSAIAFSLTPTLVARILAGKKAMPSYVPLYVRNVSRYCDKWGCKTKVGESYAERLSKIKLRK